MWPLRKQRPKSNGTKIPPEIEQYYKTARRDRMGVAWLVAFLTLVVTVAVVLLLFLGARWAFRKASNKSPKAPQTIQPQNSTKKTTNTQSSSDKTSSTQQNQTSTPTTTTSPSSSPASDPSLLRTGPEGDD